MYNTVIRRLSNVSLLLASLLALAMMIHVTGDVALKYAASAPIPGTLEIVSAYYMVAIVFFPIALVETTRSSIAVDVAYQFMPRWMQILCMGLVFAASAAVYLMLAWTSWADAVRSYQISEVMMGTVFVSVWPSRFVLPFSFVLAGAVCLWQLGMLIMSPAERERLIALEGAAQAE